VGEAALGMLAPHGHRLAEAEEDHPKPSRPS